MITGANKSKFRSAWWLPEGHTQTLWRKFSATEKIHHRRQRVDLSDGDFIDVDWCEELMGDLEANRSDEKVVVILHGLCGCSCSPYVVALQNHLAGFGVVSVAMNLRGCSGETNNLARAYHSGVSEDLNEVYETLSAAHPNAQFMFVGYSLGANVLLKWLGEIESDDRISKAVAVSTPFKLDQCSQAMLRGASRFYGSYFVNRLTADFNTKLASFEKRGLNEQVDKLKELGKLDMIKTIWAFDDQVTAPLHGFDSALSYYRQCSSARFLSQIKTDTLLIQSKNDPLIPESALPVNSTLPANVSLELHDQGGHVGFISGLRENWLEQRIKDHLIA